MAFDGDPSTCVAVVHRLATEGAALTFSRARSRSRDLQENAWVAKALLRLNLSPRSFPLIINAP